MPLGWVWRSTKREAGCWQDLTEWHARRAHRGPTEWSYHMGVWNPCQEGETRRAAGRGYAMCPGYTGSWLPGDAPGSGPRSHAPQAIRRLARTEGDRYATRMLLRPWHCRDQPHRRPIGPPAASSGRARKVGSGKASQPLRRARMRNPGIRIGPIVGRELFGSRNFSYVKGRTSTGRPNPAPAGAGGTCSLPRHDASLPRCQPRRPGSLRTGRFDAQ